MNSNQMVHIQSNLKKLKNQMMNSTKHKRIEAKRSGGNVGKKMIELSLPNLHNSSSNNENKHNLNE